MAARTTGRWSLAGTTMAPGYTDERYEDGERDALLAGWPQEVAAIRALTRPDGPKDDGSVRAPAT
jgi:hypothetical protein